MKFDGLKASELDMVNNRCEELMDIKFEKYGEIYKEFS